LTLPVRAGSKLTSAPLPLVPSDADVVPAGHHLEVVAEHGSDDADGLETVDGQALGDIAMADGAAATEHFSTRYPIDASATSSPIADHNVHDGDRPAAHAVASTDRPAPRGSRRD
jgi:hypothetical protein